MGRLRSKLAGWLFAATLCSAVGYSLVGSPAGSSKAPNIVFILADDLGYGDVRCLNPDSKIPTPSLDRLAAQGIRCTDAHSSSAVCTPTRYGVLTGRYNWRSPLKQGVLGGFSRRLIEPGRLTVAGLLKQHGYTTACIGKWHLGMDWPLTNGGYAKGDGDGWKVDYTKPIENGPNSVGFDYYFGISASLDMPPYVFIENDRVQGVPTVEKTWIRRGPAHKDFEAMDVLPALTRKAVEFVGAQAKTGKPFFLHLALNSPHTPIVPVEQWKGQSKLNPYGDFVMQTDDTVGQVMAALEKNGVEGHTLLIFASDNGCSPAANVKELVGKGHSPSYLFRGYKADIFEGGHRIPLIARWPGRIRAGSTSAQLVCLNDLMATCAEVVGATLPETAGEDSISMLPVFMGQAGKPVREAIVHHSINGSFSMREGQWKLELCPDSGGWSDPKPGTKEAMGLPAVQLYDLASDVGEKVNVHEKHPDMVAQLTKLLQKYVAEGRSTPGTPQTNTGKVNIRRAGQGNAKRNLQNKTVERKTE